MKTHLLALAVLLLSTFSSAMGYTITEGPLFSNSMVGNVFIPCFDDTHLYAYRIDEDGLRIIKFNLETFVIEKELILGESDFPFGEKISQISHTSNGNRISIEISTKIADGYALHYWETEFNINEVGSSKDINFVKKGTLMRDTKYELPTYEGVEHWIPLVGDEGVSYFFGIVFVDIPKIVCVKSETMTGKVISTDEMKFGEVFSDAYKTERKMHKYAHLRIDKIIEQSNGEMFVVVVWEIPISGYSGIGYNQAYSKEIYRDAWVFKVNDAPKIMWGVATPLYQMFSGSSAPTGYSKFAKCGIAQDDTNVYLLYNDDKDNNPSEITPSIRLDYLLPQEADDGVLAITTISKETGVWNRSVLHQNYKTRSFFNCRDGIQISDKEFIMAVDLPKKNSSRLVKITF